MSEIIYRKTTKDDMEILMKLRFEMLREVNDLTDEYEYDEDFVSESRKYFESGEQTTVIAFEGGNSHRLCKPILYMDYADILAPDRQSGAFNECLYPCRSQKKRHL